MKSLRITLFLGMLCPIILFVSSCKSLNILEGYSEDSYKGIRSLVDKTDALNILLVHGIGPTKSPRFGDGLIARLTEMMCEEALSEDLNKFNPKRTLDERPSFASSLEEVFDIDTLKFGYGTYVTIYQYPKKGKSACGMLADKKIRVFSTYWSNIPDPFKQELVDQDFKVLEAYLRAQEMEIKNNGEIKDKYDGEKKKFKNKVYINHFVKQFIVNQSFTDFLVYLNEDEKYKIQLPIIEGLRIMGLKEPYLNSFIEEFNNKEIDLSQENDIQTKSYNEFFQPSKCHAPNSEEGFVFIGRSFGSKALIDVIKGDVSNSISLKKRESLCTMCGLANQMYVFPQQVPLINTSEEARKSINCEIQLDQIVSFTDANDMLSYYVADSTFDPPIINVAVNNEERFLSSGLLRVPITIYLPIEYVIRGVKGIFRLFSPSKRVRAKTGSLKPIYTYNFQGFDPYNIHENYPDNPFIIYSMVNGINLVADQNLQNSEEIYFQKKDLAKDFDNNLKKFVRRQYKYLYREGSLDSTLARYSRRGNLGFDISELDN